MLLRLVRYNCIQASILHISAPLLTEEILWCKMIPFSSFCFPVASTPLTLRNILNELREVTAANWHQFGVQLEVDSATLNTIEIAHSHNAQRCMTEVIIRWLQNAPECSWAKLAEAVEAIGDYALAERLRQKKSQG